MSRTDNGPLFSNPVVHRDDPDSSVVAARTITESGARANHAARVLELVRDFPNATALELATHSTLAEYQVRRRLTDLKHAGLIERGPQRECRIRGSLMTTWRVKSDAP